jgi:N-acetylmuramoyl-L-alanine amidase
MTRDKDEKVSLKDRVKKANDANADIFVSIHCNAFEDPNVKGTETYHYTKSKKGKKLATPVQKELVKALGTKDRGVKEGTFYVLKYTKMPAILTEVAFISNKSEEAMLKKKKTQDKAAQAIKKGIDTYFSNETGVGGIVIPVNKLELLAPWIALATVIISTVVVIAVFVKRRRKE